jgi:DNA repair protein RadC
VIEGEDSHCARSFAANAGRGEPISTGGQNRRVHGFTAPAVFRDLGFGDQTVTPLNSALATPPNFARVFGGGFAYNFFMADSLRLKDQPVSERPRERLVARGPDALTHAELIAILLRTGLQGANVVQVAQNILQKFGSLNALALATVDELKQIAGVGPDKAATLVAAFALARRMEQERREESPVLDQPATVVNFMRETNRLKNVESFQALLLNTRKRLIRAEEISHGTLDTILVHPREVFRAAIVANAAAMVLVHNHPSGDPTPSEADIKVTRDLIRAGQLLKIEVVDHVIIGRATAERTKDFSSLRELGYFAGF